MTDFSFMKTGFDNVQNNIDKEELKKNIVSLVLTLSQNALKTASTYIMHTKRNAVTPEDLKRAMMLEMFFYKNRPDLLENAEKIKSEIFDSGYEEDCEDEEDDEQNENIVLDDEDVDAFTESTCNCALCKCLNTVYERWDKWKPASEYEELFKKHIEQMT